LDDWLLFGHFSAFFIAFIKNTNFETNDRIETNTPPRLRMTTLYMVAGAVGGRVVNTGNASELITGYFTKYGDGGADFALFIEYSCLEVIQIGDSLSELPYDLVHKTPSDGLSGLSDEENLGITYEEIEQYLNNDDSLNIEAKERIMSLEARSQHKRNINLPHPNRLK
jgi:NAD+ synthase